MKGYVVGRKARFSGLLFVGITFLAISGAAGAQDGGTGVPSGQAVQEQTARILDLEASRQVQDRLLAQSVRQVSQVGSELREAEAQVGAVRDRARELEEQTQSLRQEIAAQQEIADMQRVEYEQGVRAAYRGEGVNELAGVLGTLMGGGDFIRQFQTGRVLNYRQSNMDRYAQSQLQLENTARQLEEKNRAYEAALAEEERRAREIRQTRRQLERSVTEIGVNIERVDAEIARLEAERAELLSRPAASMGSAGGLEYEMSVAQNITVEQVEDIDLIEYQRLYREAAEQFGFGEDWYILAAIGKIESNHGENLGPSTAGALGPMQFLPSTWESYGMDGNGDGRANIMDPEDAIPAAAAYLVLNGAPEDWYRALFAYNHADWYVKEVLAIAEAYRQKAEDDSVGPYA
jgi:membrane-bound lytic murein transglycosylase B